MSSSTIYDVAGAAGVSLATVSRVLNNPEKVKPQTREKVLRIIKELGYRPNMVARGLASKKTTIVGVVISDTTRASTTAMLAGIADVANMYNYKVMVVTLNQGANLEDTLNSLVAEQVDGVLYLHEELTAKEIVRIRKIFDDGNIPYVFGNVSTNDPVIPTVSIDYFKAAYELTKRLISQGNQHIYLISTTTKISTHDKIEEGYQQAMNEAKLAPKIFKTSEDIAVNRQHFAGYFDDKKVDAAIGVRDALALSFMNVAIEEGKLVPENLSVIGFQNTILSQLARPQMTAIDNPTYDIGAVAMRLLTKLMTNEDAEQIKVLLPYRLIERKTTK